MKVHVDLSMEDPTQLCKSIVEDIVDNILNKKTSKDETSMYREKPKVNGMDEPPLSGDEIDDEELDNIIVKDNYKYTKKCKLGKKVYDYDIMNNREVDEDSLTSEYKEPLDLYMKKSVESFLKILNLNIGKYPY